MNKYTYQVFENNSGTLTLFVFDINNNIVYTHIGYENILGQLKNDLKELKNKDCNINEWDGNDCIDCDIDINDLYNQEFECSNLIADNDGIYPEIMGVSGQLEFEV